MKFARRFSPALIAILTFVFALSALSFAKDNESRFPNIKIRNFGQMDERFYRGARPKDEDYQALAALGINTIIDLTDNSMEYEKPAVEALGMRYVNIPMVDKGYPKIEQVNEFMKLVNDPSTGKFFVHCAGGRHRMRSFEEILQGKCDDLPEQAFAMTGTIDDVRAKAVELAKKA